MDKEIKLSDFGIPDSYPGLEMDISNLMALIGYKCHDDFTTELKRLNYTSEQIEQSWENLKDFASKRIESFEFSMKWFLIRAVSGVKLYE